MQDDSRERVPLLFLAYDDFFRSAKLNQEYDCQSPSGKRVYANEVGGSSFIKSGSIAPIQTEESFRKLFERIKEQIEISQLRSRGRAILANTGGASHLRSKS